MRKIDLAVSGAIHTFTPFSGGNTVFHRQANTEDGWELVLHGHVIATFDQKGDYPTMPTYINLCGYPTKTTCARSERARWRQRQDQERRSVSEREAD